MRLAVIDVDGCLTPGEGQAWNFEALKYVAQLNRKAQKDATQLAVTLCTGRPEPYVEVMMQAIDAHLPGVYEHGGGLYYPREYRFVENPLITSAMRASLVTVKAILRRDIVETGLGYFQPGKEVSLTRIEWKIFQLLYANRGKVCSMDEIAWEVWGEEGAPPELIAQHIKRLRDKVELDRSKPRYILTHSTGGYLLDL